MTETSKHAPAPGLEPSSEPALIASIQAGKKAEDVLRKLRSSHQLDSPPSQADLGNLEALVETGKRAWSAMFVRCSDQVRDFARKKRLRSGVVHRDEANVPAGTPSAEEFEHEVYERSWSRCKLATYAGRAPFPHWFGTVLFSTLMDLYREGQGRRREVSITPDATVNERARNEQHGGAVADEGDDDQEGSESLSEESASAVGEEPSKARIVRGCVDSFPAKYRAVFVLVYDLDLTRNDIEIIAEVSGRDPDDVKYLVRDLIAPGWERLEKFRDQLAEYHQKCIELETTLSEVLRPFEAMYGGSGAAEEKITRALQAEEKLPWDLVDAVNKVREVERQLGQARDRLESKRREVGKESELGRGVQSKAVAKILKISAAAVDKQLERARRMFRDCLYSEGLPV